MQLSNPHHHHHPCTDPCTAQLACGINLGINKTCKFLCPDVSSSTRHHKMDFWTMSHHKMDFWRQKFRRRAFLWPRRQLDRNSDL